MISASALDALCATFADASHSENWKLADRHSFLHVAPSDAQTEHLLFARDDTLQDFLRSDDLPYGFPENTAFVHLSRPPMTLHAAVFREQCAKARCAARWVGGASARDLTYYALLLAGGADARCESESIKVEYRGVNDAWLAAAEHAALDLKLRLHGEMSSTYKNAWSILRDCSIEWERILGPRTLGLLDSGEDVSLYPVAAAQRFRPSLREFVFHRVFD